MAADDWLDLSQLQQALMPIFEAYPAGNHCDVCAQKVADELQKAQHNVAIVTIQNEPIPGKSSDRPPFIHGYTTAKQPFLLGQTGFHQAVRIIHEDTFVYIDELVFLHYGLQAVDERTYWSLFLYSDGVEITDVREI